MTSVDAGLPRDRLGGLAAVAGQHDHRAGRATRARESPPRAFGAEPIGDRERRRPAVPSRAASTGVLPSAAHASIAARSGSALT